MIEKHGKDRELLCDGCDESYQQVHADEFTEMIGNAKHEGWRVRPDGDGGWEHHCPKCQDGSALERARKLFNR